MTQDGKDHLPDLQPGDEVTSVVFEHNQPTNERSAARRIALQVLYEIDSAKHPIGEVLTAQMSTQQVSRRVGNYVHRLVMGVTEYQAWLDEIIQRYASEFPVEQVAIVDRNILRMAVYEFVIAARTPIGVAIDEAVELAKLYGAEGAPRFVNGVLGALADDEDALIRIREFFQADDDDDDDTSQPEGDQENE